MALPVTLDQAKAQLREDRSERDDEISDFVRDAASWVEDYTGCILEAREVTEQFHGCGPFALRAWPVAPDAVMTIATGGLPVVSDFILDVTKRPARVLRAIPGVGPLVDRRQLFSVTVRAGYEDPGSVPLGMRRAMLILIAGYDDDREGGDRFEKAEATARRLCRHFKRHTL